jgi:uncharacterized coiled-coil DUF342 family protein
MSTQPLAAVERSVARARRRLLCERLLNGTAAGLSAGLAVSLGWLLAEPWILQTPPDWLRWTVLGSAAGVGFLAGVVWAIVAAPSRAAAALELDRRFDLRERVTTAVGLRPDERATPAGQAVVADASAKVAALRVGERFPVRPRPHAAGVPALAGAVALAVLFYHPDTDRLLASDEGETKQTKADDKKKAADAQAKPALPFTRQRPADGLDRKKSADLEKLEQELDQLMEKWAKTPADTDEKRREKVTELTAMEEKLRKFKEDEIKKLSQLDNQLQQLDRLSREKEFQDGPMKEVQQALSKGDLKKAEEAIDELKKKVQEKKLTSDDVKKLDKQLEMLKQEARKQAQKKEQMDALRKKIDQAKKDGKDAEGLQRELEKLAQETKDGSQALEKMAERMQKMQDAMKQGDLEKAAEELEGMAGDMKNLEGELKDLEDADDYLQRLKDDLKKACKACQGKKNGDQFREGDDAEWSEFTSPAAGRRMENKDAKTNSQDERISGLFDPKGRKSFGGSVKGPAFTKRSGVEMGTEIRQAAQEATQSVDVQRLPRDAQAGVKEYFEKIGRTGEDGKK